jgi:ribonuclease P protein component
MTPPKTEGNGTTGADTPQGSSAVLLCPQVGHPVIDALKKRPDFLRAASARRQGTGGFLLQARDRADGQPMIRVGYTASKKVGNAVMRNRAKRRLRALVHEVMPGQAQPGWDYVLVAKPGVTPDRPYAMLLADLTQALRHIHRPIDRAAHV